MSVWNSVDALRQGRVPLPSPEYYGFEEERPLIDSPLVYRGKRCAHYLTVVSWAYREAFALSGNNGQLKALERHSGRLFLNLREDEEVLALEVTLGKLVAEFEEAIENRERLPDGGHLTKEQWKAIRLHAERLLREFHEELKRTSKLKLLLQKHFAGAVYFPEQARMTLEDDKDILEVPVKAGELRDRLFEDWTAETLEEYFRTVESYSREPAYELWLKKTKEFFGDFTLSLEDCRALQEEIEVQVLWDKATAVI